MPNPDSSAGKLAFRREFALAGDTAAMFAARDEIMHFLKDHGVEGDEEIDILVALQEGLANAVTHGCGNDPAKTVSCTVQGGDAEINIAVRDPGAGFDTSILDTEGSANLSNHGRGILLMRSLMDEVSYHHHGAEVRMKKFRRQGG